MLGFLIMDYYYCDWLLIFFFLLGIGIMFSYYGEAKKSWIFLWFLVFSFCFKCSYNFGKKNNWILKNSIKFWRWWKSIKVYSYKWMSIKIKDEIPINYIIYIVLYFFKKIHIDQIWRVLLAKLILGWLIYTFVLFINHINVYI